VKKLPYIIGLLLILTILFWKRNSISEAITEKASKPTHKESISSLKRNDTSVTKSNRKTNSSEPPQYRYKHKPKHLKDFILPEISFEGESFRETLEILKLKYRETCEKTAEFPLDLIFEIPESETRPIYLKLDNKGLFDSIEIVAALAGLQMERVNSTFQFSIIENTPVIVSNEFQIINSLGILDGDFEYFSSNLTQSLEELSSTHILATNLIEYNLADVLSRQSQHPPLQIKARMIRLDIPADVDFKPPTEVTLTEEEVKLLISSTESSVSTLPSILLRDDEAAKIEITKELVDKNSNIIKTGTIVDFQTNSLGLGQTSNITFNHSQPSTTNSGDLFAETLTDISDTTFARDNRTQTLFEIKPDGTRTLILFSQTRIDATGKPIISLLKE